MLGMFGIAFSWFSSNIKYVLYAMAIIAALALANKLYNTIQENGQSQIIIETQQKTIEAKNRLIAAKEADQRLMEKALQNRDKEIEALTDKLELITDNLGTGADDQAADSLKEFFKRLQEQQ